MAAPEGYNALGKIGVSYKGEYASNTAYERLDAVYHSGSTYLALRDDPAGAPNNDRVNWTFLAKGFPSDISESEIAFEQAADRTNIATGESIKTVFGKIKKWFADMTAAAFAQIITSNTDLMATTVAGYLPDALAVKRQFDDVNSNLQWKTLSIDNGASGITIPEVWSEANVEVTFGLNPEFHTSIHVLRANIADGEERNYIAGSANSTTDCHTVNIIVTKAGVRLRRYFYAGEVITNTCKMVVSYR